jgi:hypothetical protein
VTTDAQAESLTASDSSAADSAAHAERVAAIRQAMPQWAQLASGAPPAAARNPSLPTLVGLFILILCFFVVLTSISLKDQHREKSVMASLERTFAGEGMSVPAEDEPADQAKRMLGNLRAKLGSEVPLVSGVTPETSDVLVLDLPRSLVFAGAGSDLAPAFTQILAQASQALKTGPADFAYEIEIGVSAPTLDDKAVAAGNAIAGALRAAGFANDTAMVSLTPGKTETIALTIRLRPNARLQPGGNTGGNP